VFGDLDAVSVDDKMHASTADKLRKELFVSMQEQS
jgi:hypothetical protein